jgi:hypothetical protein
MLYTTIVCMMLTMGSHCNVSNGEEFLGLVGHFRFLSLIARSAFVDRLTWGRVPSAMAMAGLREAAYTYLVINHYYHTGRCSSVPALCGESLQYSARGKCS